MPDQQAVLIFLNGTDLAQNRLGEFDGNEVGAAVTTLYMYGSEAEKLFTGVESVLRQSPLCERARVVIRHGALGRNSASSFFESTAGVSSGYCAASTLKLATRFTYSCRQGLPRRVRRPRSLRSRAISRNV